MSNAAPPAWLLGLPGLDAGAKLALLGLRSYGPFDPEAVAVFVYPSRASLARRIGQKENTLKGQLKRLTKLKIIAACVREVAGELRKGWSVADRALCEKLCRGHEVPDAGSPGTHGSQETRVSGDPTMGHEVPDAGSHSTQAGVSGDPFNLQGSCFDLVENVEDATPLESIPDENITPNSRRAPSAHPVPMAPPAQAPGRPTEAHPEHAQASLDRAQRRAPAKPGSKLKIHHPPTLSPEAAAALDACPPAKREWIMSSTVPRQWGPCMLAAFDEGFTAAHMHKALQHWLTLDVGDKPRMREFWYTKHNDWRENAAGITRKAKASGHHAPTAEACSGWTLDEAAPS